MDVRFYSYVSRRRAAKFGLPGRCHVALLPFLFPLVALERVFPRFIPHMIERLMSWALDLVVILRMRPCDVFICMSGMYLRAPQVARRRYDAKISVHRGSRHIQSQQEILASLPQAAQVTEFMMRREVEGYALADRIAVPSTHVAESFAPWPKHARKLFLNPYGVDLDQFPLWGRAQRTEPTVLFVGNWSYQKGADVLAEAIDQMDGARLIHVGALIDAPFPAHSRFIHHDPVPQWELGSFYGAAHVFALASRHDGFGMVLSQALASGLPVVCTEFTGGPDLARLPGLARLIRVVPAGDSIALRRALTKSLDEVTRKPVAPITEEERQALSWKAYALRELEFISGILQSSDACIA
jgi:glycosyltransferase involved in cell wall biosynthesis